MMKQATTALFCALLTLALAAPAHAEDILNHEKYQLDNGLTVILHEDHTLPLVVVNIWYQVGTREEPRGRSGFAHLFEHLMFMGTERVPGSQFDLIMEAGGGSNNATTGWDRTRYYDEGPAGLLPTLLWLEADRMASLGKAMTQKKLDLQRDVVRNERRQMYDNAPYGPSEILHWELMYPVDHPYHFHVIGSHEDLLAATVDDVKQFFDSYYVPNNASLVVAGDFQPEKVKPLIEGLFGSIPRGAAPPRRSTPPVGDGWARRVILRDNVQLPRLRMTWHTPPLFAPGDAEMDLIASALGEGKNGRLYRRLVHEEQLAVEVDVAQYSARLGSMFNIEVTAKRDADRDRIEAIIDQVLRRFQRQGPTGVELRRGRTELVTSSLTQLQSLLRRADRLNWYEEYLGKPNSLKWDLDRYRNATRESVRCWSLKLPVDKRLVMWVLPQAEPKPDLPTRESRPTDFETASFTPPVPSVFELKNGLRVWHVHRPGLPLMAVRLVMPGGSRDEDPAQAGVAELTGTLLKEGAGRLDALAFGHELEMLGTELEVTVDREGCLLDVHVLKGNFARALELLALAATAPRFDADAFARTKTIQRQQLGRVIDEPADLAKRVGYQAFFEPSPYALPPGGFPSTLAALEPEQVRAFHARNHLPHGSVLLVAGDLPLEVVRRLAIRHFGSWRPKGPLVAPVPSAKRKAEEGALRLLLVDRPGAAQTAVRFVLPGVRFADEARVELSVLNSLLGGTFTSRLNANLREKHGFTYGAGSRFVTYETDGAFVAASRVQSDKTGPALREFFLEFRRIQSGDVTQAEGQKARASIHNEWIQEFETLSDLLEAFTPYARYDRKPDALAADVASVGGVTLEILNALGDDHVSQHGGVLVLVGDAKLILPQLEGLDLPRPVLLTADQALEGQLR